MNNKLTVRSMLNDGRRPFLSEEGEVCRIIEAMDELVRFKITDCEARRRDAASFAWMTREERKDVLSRNSELLEPLINMYSLGESDDALAAVLAYEFDDDAQGRLT